MFFQRLGWCFCRGLSAQGDHAALAGVASSSNALVLRAGWGGGEEGSRAASAPLRNLLEMQILAPPQSVNLISVNQVQPHPRPSDSETGDGARKLRFNKPSRRC